MPGDDLRRIATEQACGHSSCLLAQALPNAPTVFEIRPMRRPAQASVSGIRTWEAWSVRELRGAMVPQAWGVVSVMVALETKEAKQL